MLARDGYSTIGFVIVIAAAVSFAASWLDSGLAWAVYGMMILFVLFFVYFFRDPDRSVPPGDDLVIAPADGKVVAVTEVEENAYLKQKVKQVSIFLSPLDVHVNRIPVSGTVEYLKYHPGQYLMAFDHRASELNERSDFGVRHRSGTRMMFRQVTGFLARRIVYRLDVGDEVRAGERFGIMKFGSRMDILVPDNVDLQVRKGDYTVGGETILGRIGQR